MASPPSTPPSPRALSLEAELAVLARERRDIISGLTLQNMPELESASDRLAARLQLAADARDYSARHLRAHFDLEKQQAWDEYCAGKARLREDVLGTHMERRKRLDVLKTGGMSSRRLFFPSFLDLCLCMRAGCRI